MSALQVGSRTPSICSSAADPHTTGSEMYIPTISSTGVLAAGEPDACVLLVVLVEFERSDLRTFERQLHLLQVEPLGLAHVKRLVLDSGSDVPSGYSQLLPVPWARGAESACCRAKSF